MQKATCNKKTLHYAVTLHHWLKEDWLDVLNPHTLLVEGAGREVAALFTSGRDHRYQTQN